MVKIKRVKHADYDWDGWFEQPSFQLVRGKHFQGMTHAMAVQVRHAAQARKLRVSVHILDNKLAVEVIGKLGSKHA